MTKNKENPSNEKITKLPLTITIDNGKNLKRIIRLSPFIYHYGLISFTIFVIFSILSSCLAGYLLITSQSSTNSINSLQKANALEQKQIIQLAQKASLIQKQLNKLSDTEKEIINLSNLSLNLKQDPDNKTSDEKGGQGGPYITPNCQNVNGVFNDIEKRIKLHEDNLSLLRQALINKRQQTNNILSKTITTPTGWPTSGFISSPYGFRWNGTDFHPGVDIAADYGTPIHATASGTITYAGWNSGGYGNMVDIDHGNGIMTRYGHASSVIVHTGQHVVRGQVIAYVGSTGYSTGPHVHYEVRLHGKAIDPMPYL